MFDLKWIRENPDAFDKGLQGRGLEPAAAKLIEMDDARRRHLTSLQEAQARRSLSLEHCPDPHALERANYARMLSEWRG